MKTVNIPGVGVVDFPDEMSDMEIQTAIEQDILKMPPMLQAAPITAPTAQTPQEPSAWDRAGKFGAEVSGGLLTGALPLLAGANPVGAAALMGLGAYGAGEAWDTLALGREPKAPMENVVGGLESAAFAAPFGISPARNVPAGFSPQSNLSSAIGYAERQGIPLTPRTTAQGSGLGNWWRRAAVDFESVMPIGKMIGPQKTQMKGYEATRKLLSAFTDDVLGIPTPEAAAEFGQASKASYKELSGLGAGRKVNLPNLQGWLRDYWTTKRASIVEASPQLAKKLDDAYLSFYGSPSARPGERVIEYLVGKKKVLVAATETYGPEGPSVSYRVLEGTRKNISDKTTRPLAEALSERLGEPASKVRELGTGDIPFELADDLLFNVNTASKYATAGPSARKLFAEARDLVRADVGGLGEDFAAALNSAVEFSRQARQGAESGYVRKLVQNFTGMLEKGRPGDIVKAYEQNRPWLGKKLSPEQIEAFDSIVNFMEQAAVDLEKGSRAATLTLKGERGGAGDIAKIGAEIFFAAPVAAMDAVLSQLVMARPGLVKDIFGGLLKGTYPAAAAESVPKLNLRGPLNEKTPIEAMGGPLVDNGF